MSFGSVSGVCPVFFGCFPGIFLVSDGSFMRDVARCGDHQIRREGGPDKPFPPHQADK